jgi:N-methylhydantoinase A
VDAVFDLKLMRTPVYARDRLMPGNEMTGPAIVVEYSATTVIDPGHKAKVNKLGGIEIWRA